MIAPLFEVPLQLILVMLAVMFFSVIICIYFLSCFIPQLTKDSHANTNWLDGLRGIAAILVALNHVSLVIVNLMYMPKSFYFPLKEAGLFDFLGSIGVQMFFCITGVLFAKKILFASESLTILVATASPLATVVKLGVEPFP